jgi:hypothetical protein
MDAARVLPGVGQAGMHADTLARRRHGGEASAMPASTVESPAPTLSDERLADLLKLAASADSVELKLTVPETAQFETARALGMDPLDAQIRQVFFFDTPDLALNEQGVVVRARRVQGKRGDTVVKLRPVVPEEMPKALRQSPSFVVELDAMPGGHVCSATLKSRTDNADVREVALGARPLAKLFSKQQRAFLSDHAPAGPRLDELSLLGPIPLLKLKFEPEGYDRRLVAELWMYPDGSRVFELSTKCEPRDALLVAAQTRVFLSDRGVDLSSEQQTKTKKALDFFSAQLR